MMAPVRFESPREPARLAASAELTVRKDGEGDQLQESGEAQSAIEKSSRGAAQKEAHGADRACVRCAADGDTAREPGASLRAEFPIFEAHPGLCYLDTGASAQKPRAVLDALDRFHREGYSNIHRGVYPLSERATADFELVREKVRRLLNARSTRDIVFTSGTTAAINLVAQSYGRSTLRVGDEIIVTLLEHHANFVPWQLIARETGATVRYVGLDSEGRLSREEMRAALNERTKIVALTALSNGLGVAPPIGALIKEAHDAGAVVLVDGAQAVLHSTVDVRELDADFYVFSGHKLYGPTGVGVLYGKEALLERMPPFLSGGDMIRHVSVEGTTFNDVPFKFEAGTPNIAGVIGLGAAIDFVDSIGMEKIERYEAGLLGQFEQMLHDTPEVTVLGPRFEHHGALVFTVDGVHPHDVAQILAGEGIAVRAGHHCAQPLLRALGVTATTRVSLGVYNVPDEVDRLHSGLQKVRSFFRR